MEQCFVIEEMRSYFPLLRSDVQVNMEIRREVLKSLAEVMAAYGLRCFYEKVSRSIGCSACFKL